MNSLYRAPALANKSLQSPQLPPHLFILPSRCASIRKTTTSTRHAWIQGLTSLEHRLTASENIDVQEALTKGTLWYPVIALCATPDSHDVDHHRLGLYRTQPTPLSCASGNILDFELDHTRNLSTFDRHVYNWSMMVFSGASTDGKFGAHLRVLHSFPVQVHSLHVTLERAGSRTKSLEGNVWTYGSITRSVEDIRKSWLGS